MKRGGPLARRTPLRARTELRRVTPLDAGDGPTRGAWTPPAPRRAVTPAERRARQLVTARARGRCEGCGLPGPTEWSHRIARSRGGLWCPSNGLALCPGHHSWAHAHPDLARERGWHVRTGHDPSTVPAFLAAYGLVLLDRRGGITPTTWSAA